MEKCLFNAFDIFTRTHYKDIQLKTMYDLLDLSIEVAQQLIGGYRGRIYTVKNSEACAPSTLVDHWTSSRGRGHPGGFDLEMTPRRLLKTYHVYFSIITRNYMSEIFTEGTRSLVRGARLF